MVFLKNVFCVARYFICGVENSILSSSSYFSGSMYFFAAAMPCGLSDAGKTERAVCQYILECTGINIGLIVKTERGVNLFVSIDDPLKTSWGTCLSKSDVALVVRTRIAEVCVKLHAYVTAPYELIITNCCTTGKNTLRIK
jgi:hypothetical protein